MKTMKLKEIKEFVYYGSAKDITHEKEHIKDLTMVGVSIGIYGRNGLLLKDKDSNYYAITKRTSNIFAY